MCLQVDCTHFSLTSTGHALAAPAYSADFLHLASNAHLGYGPEVTEVPEPELEPEDGVATTLAFKSGLWCRRCGRLSCR